MAKKAKANKKGLPAKREQAPQIITNEMKESNGKTKYSIDYLHLYENVYRQELDDWVRARAERLDPFRPSTYLLQQLYKDVMLDNHLAGAIENQRVLPLLNRSFVIRDASGKINDEATSTIQGSWFRRIIREVLMSKFYGYTLIFVNNLNSDNPDIIDIKREAVIPEKGRILSNPLDPTSNGIDYNDFPSYFLYASLGFDSVGLLTSIAPSTILKRHSWASWDQLEQIFGLPLRIARTAIATTDHIDEIQQWLEAMGTASYGIFDKNTDVELIEAKHTDAYHIYFEKIKAANAEISKRVLGQTMTSDDGSSQSQAEVHLKILKDVQKSDSRDIIDWVNDHLLQVLRANDFNIPEDASFDIIEERDINPLDQIKIDQVLLQNGFNLDKDYIEDKYGTLLDKNNPRTVATNPAGELNFFE